MRHAVGMVMLMVSLGLMVIAGLLGAGMLLPRLRVVVWVSLGLTLAWAQWLVAALLARMVLSAAPASVVFLLVGGGACLLAVIAQWRQGWPRLGWHWQAEVPVFLVTGAVIVAALPILAVNGWQGDTWVTHGFYNGDTATFISLVQRSLREGSLVTNNPFAAHGALEYPTLIHAGVADIVRMTDWGVEWLAWLPWLTVVFIAMTVPLLFGMIDALIPAKKEADEWLGWWRGWSRLILTAGMVAYVLALSWDTYVYPQSHFFITGLFLLAGLLWSRAWGLRGKTQWAAVAVALVLTFLLLLANAVTGTAAVAVAIVFAAGRAMERSRPVAERALFMLFVPVWLLAFVALPPGEGALGLVPGLSYTAAPDMLRLSVVMLVLLAACMWRISSVPFVAGSVVALGLAALVTFVFSERNIVVENASRFFYHAVLIGFPLLLYPLTRAFVWLRRELVFSAYPLLAQLTQWGIVASGVSLLLLPALASMASTYDNLLFKDEQRVSAAMIEGLAWLDTMTEVDAVVAASPRAPFAVPMFAGRAMLRADYWLSPGDALEHQVIEAFAGEAVAQGIVRAQADYVFLVGEEREQWHIPGEPVFENAEVAIYES